MKKYSLTAPGESPKVSIIIPVYNAEKYLGYCLNSVLSQTYTNWKAILVDDGSTDDSLSICRNYEAIDARFQVISKPNGGVSSARNAGLLLAEGDYLEFLDSDDCLTNDALEKQVALAVKNKSQLVIANATMLDFNHPDGEQIKLTSNWLGQPCNCLSAQEFREKRMRLIWFTALLESPWAKLYDLKLWRKLELSFPEELSLGEDFVTNLKYYDACNSAVFLNECCYYYNQYTGSGSLTEKYRPDLFDNKMYLNEVLEKHLGGRRNLQKPELDAFYDYAASNGWRCVDRMALSGELDEKHKLACLRKMFAHSLFAESVFHAEYTPERFSSCVVLAKKKKYKKMLRYLMESAAQESQKNSQPENGEAAAANAVPEQPACRSGKVNRAIRKVLRFVRPALGNGRTGEKVSRLEKEIELLGLKNTLDAHLEGKMTSTKRRIDLLESHVNQVQVHIEGHVEQAKDDIGEYVNQAQNEIDAHLERIREEINGYTWISEQRMSRHAYLNEINELRQKKKAIMVATAEHANIGDAAITLAEQQILGEQFPEYFQVEISTYEFNQKEAFLHAILNPEDILFIHGGGNLGDLYLVEENLRRKIVSEFPNNKTVILPQTICFSDTQQGKLELKESSRIYNGHKDLTLFVRGETSLEIAKKHFDRVKTVLMPDSVHALRCNYAFDRSGVLLCLREDDEKKLDKAGRERIVNVSANLVGDIERCTNIYSEDVTRDIRGLVVRRELMRFARHRVVITDRLHGMIFSAITGTPCVVLSSYNHKISEYYDAFFRDSNAVFFIGNDLDKLEGAIGEALLVTEARYPVFERDDLAQICPARMNGIE